MYVCMYVLAQINKTLKNTTDQSCRIAWQPRVYTSYILKCNAFKRIAYSLYDYCKE